MDSATLLGLVGIVGTLLGASIGVYGTTRAAKITALSQLRLEDRRAQREAYQGCNTVLTTRYDSLRQALDHITGEHFSPDVLLGALDSIEGQRDQVVREVGAVQVAAPTSTARCAQLTADSIENLYGVLKYWGSRMGAGELERGDLLTDPQFTRAHTEGLSNIQSLLDMFNEACSRDLDTTSTRWSRLVAGIKEARRHGAR